MSKWKFTKQRGISWLSECSNQCNPMQFLLWHVTLIRAYEIISLSTLVEHSLRFLTGSIPNSKCKFTKNLFKKDPTMKKGNISISFRVFEWNEMKHIPSSNIQTVIRLFGFESLQWTLNSSLACYLDQVFWKLIFEVFILNNYYHYFFQNFKFHW